MNHLTKAQKRAIEADASSAAVQGLTPAEACPWPSNSPESLHWLAVWLLARGGK
jgi:hypothetical protein